MAYSRNTVVLNGATDIIAVPFPFLERSHVGVALNNVPATFSWLTNGTIKLAAVPAAGTVCIIKRTTPASDILVRFTSPDELSGDDLNTGLLQLLYVVQEAFDLSATAADGVDGVINYLNQITDLYDQIVTLSQQVTDDRSAVAATLLTMQELLVTAQGVLTAVEAAGESITGYIELSGFGPEAVDPGVTAAAFVIPEPLTLDGVSRWAAFHQAAPASGALRVEAYVAETWVPLGSLTFSGAVQATAAPLTALPLDLAAKTPVRLVGIATLPADFIFNISFKRTA